MGSDSDKLLIYEHENGKGKKEARATQSSVHSTPLTAVVRKDAERNCGCPKRYSVSPFSTPPFSFCSVFNDANKVGFFDMFKGNIGYNGSCVRDVNWQKNTVWLAWKICGIVKRK